MGIHPLVTFVYDTFGQQFGGLLLTGYGAEPRRVRRMLYITESESGVETDWVIRLVTSHLPCRDEPLVLAALLKLLLSHANISQYLRFEPGELLTILQWRDDGSTRRQVDSVIGCYVRLLYDKQVDARAGRRSSSCEGGGYYHLLTGYARENKSVTDAAITGAASEVYFDSGFINGLRYGRVYFAGIDFGAI